MEDSQQERHSINVLQMRCWTLAVVIRPVHGNSVTPASTGNRRADAVACTPTHLQLGAILGADKHGFKRFV